MDITKQQPNTPINAKLEDGTFSKANDILQILIDSVDDILKDIDSTSFPSPELLDISTKNVEKNNGDKQGEPVISTECNRVSSTEQPDIAVTKEKCYLNFQDFFKDANFKSGPMPSTVSVKEKQIPCENKQEDLMRSTECESGFRSASSTVSVKEEQISCENKPEDWMRSTECESGFRSVSSTVSVKEEQTACENKQEDLMRSTECEIGFRSMSPSVRDKEEEILCENKQDDLMRNTGFSNGCPVIDVKEEEKYIKNNQDFGSLSEHNVSYFALENNECVDGFRINPIKELSPDSERVSRDDTLSISNNSLDITIESSEDLETSTDSSDDDFTDYDDDDEEDIFVIAELSEEVGDQEGSLDNRSIFERIVQYVRETDMLLMAKRGGGDHMDFDFDIDDDSDDELVNELFE